MLDLNLVEIMQLLKTEPGAGLTQTFLLFMIWLNSRKISKKLDLHTAILSDPKTGHEVRLTKLETAVFKQP